MKGAEGGGGCWESKGARYKRKIGEGGVCLSMRLTWEKIKRSLGIPDKLTDAETADEIAGHEVERLAHQSGLASGGAEGTQDLEGRSRGAGSEGGGAGEGGDAQTSPEFTGRNQPQIESGPWGALADQDGPQQYAGIPEAVLDNALYSQDQEIGEIGGTGGSGEMGAQHDDGVYVTPTPITLGETVHVKYAGPLTEGNPPALHLHWGFGPGQWTHVEDVAMERDGDAYTATLNVHMDGRFEFCFHDNAGNWDNNDGRNWSYIIHDGELPGEYVVERD